MPQPRQGYSVFPIILMGNCARAAPRVRSRPGAPLVNVCHRLSRVAAASAALLGALALACAQPSERRVLGATETIHVPEAGIDLLAVVDTGAYRTSIHATAVEVEDPAPSMRDNVGKRISFRIANERGRAQRITSTVADVEPVRTSHGTEWRYIVPLRLRWKDVEKEVHVNLRDRTPMTYKLLVGRDWIRGFLVDVERNAVEAPPDPG
jgi:hypothetical protein